MEQCATAIVADSATELNINCFFAAYYLNEGTPKRRNLHLKYFSTFDFITNIFCIFVLDKTNFTMNKFLSFLLLFSCSFYAQSKYNNFSLEFASGYTSPVQPYLSENSSNFAGFNHINIGGRYMFSEKFGVRVEYVNDRFIDNSDIFSGTYFNRFGAQLVYNLGKDLDLLYITNEQFGLLTHAGVGYTRSTIKRLQITEQIGSAVIGITPQYKLSDRSSLFLDFSSVFNFKQHYRFDGSLISPDFVPTIGNHYNITIGIMLYIGENRLHNDWY